MTEKKLPEDLVKAVEFHGHLCPGLVMGYLAAKAGMERLAAARAEDEELIAIVENDSCAVDAVQVLTGCTFGKGNLFYRDHGKQVYTFAVRPSGRAVRVSLKHERPREGQRAGASRHGGWEIRYMLGCPPEELFSIREETILLPEAARIRQSVLCESCGEMVMETRARRLVGRLLCIPCQKAITRNNKPKLPAKAGRRRREQVDT